jgi:EAL domain-containing protein (putative c-di-GMP-specific phosphodiesterase class I)
VSRVKSIPVAAVQRAVGPAGDVPTTPVQATSELLGQAVEQMLREQRAPKLVFQPIVDLQRGVTVGYEVLSRFAGPPALTPDRWFKAAYELGRGSELEELVLREALAARATLPINCFLSLNVAPEALLDERVANLLRAQSLSRIVIELTEHAAVADYDLLAHVIAEARGHGAFVAVDDAGAGYASLQHILALRPDFVKLDRALIAGLQLDEAKAALVEMFGGFTSRIDSWLLAEGIEEQSELSRLAQLGVPLGQGYFLGRPSPRMDGLPDALARSLRGPDAASADRSIVRSLVEPHHSASSAAHDAELLVVLLDNPLLSFLPLLDESARPLALALRFGSHELVRRAPMCVLDATPVREALERALTRAAAARFDPLLCCSELGHYEGVVRIERLIEASLTACR